MENRSISGGKGVDSHGVRILHGRSKTVFNDAKRMSFLHWLNYAFPFLEIFNIALNNVELEHNIQCQHISTNDLNTFFPSVFAIRKIEIAGCATGNTN